MIDSRKFVGDGFHGICYVAFLDTLSYFNGMYFGVCTRTNPLPEHCTKLEPDLDLLRHTCQSPFEHCPLGTRHWNHYDVFAEFSTALFIPTPNEALIKRCSHVQQHIRSVGNQ